MSKSRDIRKEKKTAPRTSAAKSSKPETSPISAFRTAGKKTSQRSKT